MRRAILIAAALGVLAPSAQAAKVDPEAFRPYAAGLIDRLTVGAERLAGSIETGQPRGGEVRLDLSRGGLGTGRDVPW